MRPSDTRRGKRWLENFHPTDRDAAELLLNSIEIADEGRIRAGLIAGIEGSREHAKGGSVLVMPVLEVRDVHRLLLEQAGGDESALPEVGEHVAYRTFQPGMPINSTPGSEGAVGNLVRLFTGDDPHRYLAPWLHPRSSLDGLRKRLCRTVLLVSDNAGSGQQVINFAETFARNRTIRSWRSSGLVDIAVVVFAASARARAAMEMSQAIDHIKVIQPAASFSDMGWSETDRQEIERVCLRYAGKDQSQALGFQGSRGLFVMHTGIPNNTPHIIRRTGPDWQPFFERKVFPEDLKVELGDYRTTPAELSALAHSQRQSRLARAIASGRLSGPTDVLTTVLALQNYRRRSPAELAHILHLPDTAVEEMLKFLFDMEMLTPDSSLTALGRRELSNAKRLERVVTAKLRGTEDPYYPFALR